MNEAHGPAAKQIFDLAHHRRPIAFTSPSGDGKSRRETVEVLSKALEEALRGVIKLGLRGGYGGDDDVQHQRQLSDVQSTFQASRPYRNDAPRIEFSFRPTLFRPKRWADAEALETLVRKIGPRTDRFHQFPPQPKGTAPMDWGIFNDTYGDPWAITYAGQFWCEFMVGGRQSKKLSERDAGVSPEPPENLMLPEGSWVMADYALAKVSSAFQFARNLADVLPTTEQVTFELSARNIRGTWLSFEYGDTMGPCRAPTINRRNETTAAEFKEHWEIEFSRTAKDFCDLFCRDGRLLSLADISSYQNQAGNY